MNKIVKRIFIGLGILVLLILASAIIVPVFFKDKVLSIVKTEMNKNLNAVTDFKDVDISILSHFPQLTIGIEQLSISGIAEFKNDTLIAAKEIEVSVDLMKAINGTYEILNIGLVEPRIHAIVHDNGKANWDITKPDTTTKTETAAAPWALKLKKYSIEKGYIEYRDELGKTFVVLQELNHSGSGDFSSDQFILKTHTDIDAMSYASGNIPYLNKVKTLVDIDLDINNKESRYSFNTDKIQLNGLKLSTKGFVKLPDSLNTIMDIKFSTPSNDFKDILSLVPGIYQNNFKDIKTTGKATLSGMILGKYNATTLPAFNFKLAVDNGSFQYPDLPQKVSDIQLKLTVDNPDGITNHTVINLEKGHILFGTDPFDFRLLLRTPISNQSVDASMKGRLDLASVQKFVKLEAGTKLSGLVNADVSVKGPVSAATQQKFDQIFAAGTIALSNLYYASKDYPDGVSVNSLLLTFNPKNVTVSNFIGKYVDINFKGDGYINNLLGYYLHNEALNGSLHFAADKVDLNKFMGATSSKEEEKTTTPATVFLVPDNLDITLKTEVGTLIYDKLTMTDVNAGLMIRNQIVNLQNVSAKALDGTIKMNGFYATKTDKKNPDIQFDYSLEGIDVPKTYNAFEMVKKMMPAAKYVSGKMTSHLSMSGKLGGDMMPVMNSLTGKGDLMMLSGVLSGFPVTEQIANKLSLSQLKQFPIKDLKLFFSFENGRVTVQPYKLKIGNIDAEIAGSHGFDQTIQYGVNMAVPRESIGSQGNAVVNNLLNQANSKGLNLKVGDKVNLTMNITGTVTQPKIETNLKNIAGSAVDNVKKELEEAAKKKIDSVKSVVKDTAKAIANQALNTAKDELTKQFLGNKDTSKKNPVNDALNKAGDKVGDKVKDGINSIFGKKKK